MGRSLRTGLVVAITCAVLWGFAPAHSLDGSDSGIAGTDLKMRLPDGWHITPKFAKPEELRAFLDAFPVFAAQLGLRASSSDADLVRAFERATKDVVEMAFDPTDGDT